MNGDTDHDTEGGYTNHRGSCSPTLTAIIVAAAVVLGGLAAAGAQILGWMIT